MMSHWPRYVLLLALSQIVFACNTEQPLSRLATPDEIRSIQRDPASNGGQGPMDEAANHMLMSPTRPAKPGDSSRALDLADQIRKSIAKYEDTATAISAGYEHFVQDDAIKEVHFINYSVPITESVDPDSPTAILYLRTDDGLKLSGAMYSVIGSPSTLESATPLSLVNWHKHVNWCLPKLHEQQRWSEKRDGRFVFGNFGTSSARHCSRAGGLFFPDLEGWMVHANVAAGKTISEIWGGTQMGSGDSHHH